MRQQVDKNQREYYLKEQLRAIQEELGHDQASEVAELREKVVPDGAEAAEPEILARRGEAQGAGGARILAREGLLELGYSASEESELLESADGEQTEELVASALRGARR